MSDFAIRSFQSKPQKERLAQLDQQMDNGVSEAVKLPEYRLERQRGYNRIYRKRKREIRARVYGRPMTSRERALNSLVTLMPKPVVVYCEQDEKGEFISITIEGVFPG